VDPVEEQVMYESNQMFEEARLDDIPVDPCRVTGGEIRLSIGCSKDDDRQVREVDIGTKSLEKVNARAVPRFQV